MVRTPPTLPLGRDASSRFLPWITAFMVYLAVLALAFALALDGAARRWEEGSIDRLTVQYLPPAEAPAGASLEALVEVLRATPGVRGAEPLPRAALIGLLEPWLGANAPYDELPLPQLIDVETDPEARLNRAALAATLAADFPGATLDDPAAWLGRLAALARSLEAVAAAIVLLVVLAAVGTVVVSTQMGMAAHRETIEIVHLIGAQDSYLARQFERQALTLALKGAAVGLGLAVATGFALVEAGSGISTALVPRLELEPWHLAAVLALPLAIALIVMLTARTTVLRALARLP